VLLGPGRWGTASPELGIPVVFSEINRVSVLCEIVAMRDNLVPDVSLGTHFLNELVEMNMLYLALFPGQGSNRVNTAFFEQSPNSLLQLIPSAGKWTRAVRVIDALAAVGPDASITLAASCLERRVSCFRVHAASSDAAS
jgi:hypothetical protein